MDKSSDIIDLNYSDIPGPIKVVLIGIGCVGMFVLWILRPVYAIRLGLLVNERLGETSKRVEMYLRRRADGEISSREKHIFVSGKPANEQLFKMVKRYISVLEVNRYFLWLTRKLQKMFKRSSLWLNYDSFENIYTVFDTMPAQLVFTPEEEDRGRKLLESMDIDHQGQFVCLSVRDKAYLDKLHPYRGRGEWAYHDFRDADIDNYASSAEYLASKGVYTIRMGFMVEKKFDLNNSYVIDYANKHRCDFGDIYLSAKCKFFIGTEGGLITIPWIFNVPVAYSNRIPVTAVGGYHHSNIFMPKKLMLSAEKRFLTFLEIHDLGASRWFRSEQYQQAGIEIVENTPEEILGLIREMNERLDGTWVETEESKDLQKRYWDIWPKELEGYQSDIPFTDEWSPVKCNGSLPRISTEFLRLNSYLLDKTTKKVLV